MQAQDEYRIQFGYDSAGNQILRDRVCINCNSAKSEVDSTAIAELDEKNDLLEDDSNSSEIFAYPNPTTNILQVEWVADENNVVQVVVFSGDGRQLESLPIKSNWRKQDLNFSMYPTGRYIVTVLYADKTKQSFQVIKN